MTTERVRNDYLTNDQRQGIQAARRLDETCHTDFAHIDQVTRLALKLYDELAPLHECSPIEKYWLHMASLLHDTGWIEGAKGHHKASLQIILNTPMLPLDSHERLLIGSIARYHRKAYPSLKHDHYRALDVYERHTVSVLAGILRVADGLDQRHLSAVEDIRVILDPPVVKIQYMSELPAQIEAQAAQRKCGLLEKALNIQLVFEEVVV